MDSYFPKTRRPSAGLSSSIKRPAPAVTPPKAAKIPATPRTPKDARLTRPLKPPPAPKKLAPPNEQRKRPISVRELFTSAHSLDSNSNSISLSLKPLRTATPITPSPQPQATLNTVTPPASPLKTAEPVSPSKITNGPLKGVSTSLLDLIRAKEAAAKATTPEQERRKELLGIAPEIVRIVPTLFTATKRDVLPYDKVVDKCFKGLKSNYTTETIIDCLNLMDKVTPEWVSTVEISRGKFMRINRDKYTIPQLLEAIRRFKRD